MPTRGRPSRAFEAIASFLSTNGGNADLLIACDFDDPDRFKIEHKNIRWAEVAPMGMAQTFSVLASVNTDAYNIIGLTADDVTFNCPVWDYTLYTEFEQKGTGIYYGPSNLRTDDLCSHPFITSDIIRALGYAAAPGSRHLYLDNLWREIGKSIDRYFFIKLLVMDHIHFTRFPHLRDEGYDRVNSEETYAHDKAVFETWRDSELPKVLPKLKALCA